MAFPSKPNGHGRKPPRSKPAKNGRLVRDGVWTNNPVGRPSKLTPERLKRLRHLIELGMPNTRVAFHLGISIGAFQMWYAKGMTAPPGTPYRQFYDVVREARETAEISLLAKVQRIAVKDFRAAQYLLGKVGGKDYRLDPFEVTPTLDEDGNPVPIVTKLEIVAPRYRRIDARIEVGDGKALPPGEDE